MPHVNMLVLALALAAFQAGCTIVTSQPNTTGNCTSVTAGSSAGGSAGVMTGSGGGGGTAGVTMGLGGELSAWTNVTSNLAGITSECGNLSDLSAKPDEDMLIAGIAQAGLWASMDGGGTWSQLGTDPSSDTIINRTSAIVYDPQTSARFWESGLYNSSGVYETEDDGNTFVAQGDIVHSDLVSVDFSDPERKTLLAGGHEQSQTLSLSIDGGKTWTMIGSSLPPNTNCTRPLIIDGSTYLVGCAGFGGGTTGIFRSDDGGGTWSQLTTSGGGSAPLQASDGSIYWASPDAAGMTRSTDNGATWTDVVGPGVISSVAPLELPDGRLATLSTNNVVVSDDHGATWLAACAPLPYGDAVGVTYSTQEKAFFIWHFTCGASPVQVPADAVMRCNFDYEAN